MSKHNRNRRNNQRPSNRPQDGSRRSNRFTAPRPTGPTGVYGVRGLKTAAGRINEEWNTLLKSWNKEVKTYLEMRDDVIVGTLLDAIKLPLLRATFEVNAAPANTPGDQAAADWLYEAMNRMRRQTWQSHTNDCLDSLDFGFSVSEITLEKRSDGRMWPKNIDPRGQETLDRWGFGKDDEKDTALSFIQRDPDGGGIYEIPLSKCVHVTFRGRKGNPQGKSLLRSIFRPWRMCKDLENLEAIGIERDVGGMPVATLPEGDIGDEDETDLKEALKNLRMDDAMYLLLPNGVEVAPYSSGAKVYDVAAVIERKQKEILGRLFAQFLKLGMDNVGTQALVKGSQDFFMLALGSVQDALVEAWNQQLVPYLFAFNTFPGMSELPEIVWNEPGRVDVASLINAFVAAAGAKLFTPTDVDEDHIRELLDWPELPESERGMPRDVEAPAGPLFDRRAALQTSEGKELLNILATHRREQGEGFRRLERALAGRA
ncbi:MAG: hypothetical protein PHU12_04690 [Candidatus Aenigmarchaeota archaeon]|nr:hypothetical protein [Candidatus Aenigmarchaeota archaeon]